MQVLRSRSCTSVKAPAGFRTLQLHLSIVKVNPLSHPHTTPNHNSNHPPWLQEHSGASPRHVVAHVLPLPRLASNVPLQELTEVTKDPPPSMKVQLVDESDVHVWEVLIDGPEQSVYAVSTPDDLPFTLRKDSHAVIFAGRPVPPAHHPSQGLPLQAADAQLPHEDLPSQRQQ